MGKDGIMPKFSTVGAGTPGMNVGPAIGGLRCCHQGKSKELIEIDSIDFSNLAGDKVLATQARVASGGKGDRKKPHDDDQGLHSIRRR